MVHRFAENRMGTARRLGFVSTAAIGLVLMVPSHAVAQTTPGGAAPVPDATPSGNGLGEIVVTAQRRSENMQKVPISVMAADAASLGKANIKSVADLGIIAPSLTFIDDGAYAHPYLRGIGTAAQGPGIENSVALYIDGVYQAASVGGASDFNNIKSVEVINGPQGTLFGRNATAGLIQIRTLDPSFDFSGRASIGYGNYDTSQASAYLTGGVTDKIATNVAIDYSNQPDGYFRNVVDGREVDKTRKISLRSKVLFKPSDRVKFVLAGNYGHIDFDPLDAPVPGSVPSGGAVPGLQDRQYASSVPSDGRITQYGTSLTGDIDLGAVHLQSITAFEALNSHQLFGNSIPNDEAAYNVSITEPHRQFSQELQLSSPATGRFTWTAGLYYFHEKAKYDPAHLFGVGLFPLSDIYYYTTNKTDSYAAYAQGTYKITPTTRVTGGFRYSWDKRTNDITEVLMGLPAIFGKDGTVIPSGGKKTFRAPTWRVSIDQDITQDILAYASYNRGFKSGGFNATQVPAVSYQPEKLDAFEVGLKTQFFDRHLRFNLAAFYYKYSNIQIQNFPNGVLFITNGARARVYGADLTADAVITRNFRLNGALSLLNTKFTSYPDADESFPNVDANGVPTGGNTYETVSATGDRLPHAPKLTASVGGTYTIPTSAGNFELNANYAYNDGWDGEVGGRLHQKVYSLVNGQVSWTTANGKFEIAVWGKNLTNENYALTIFSTSDSDRIKWAPPRTFGATGTVKF